ncbi:Sarcolemmal membrane-associated protein [Portunus trituberculatus]|uniref:Sarcolemmal membrane-associated protein n=1 Tax=Portunus trituberculatus TaxID=210409 RepID=A0A5B7G6K7_PORTR|nr:Sarcolemmal membrane-associated protein [Portunus trituberculatus]
MIDEDRLLQRLETLEAQLTTYAKYFSQQSRVLGLKFLAVYARVGLKLSSNNVQSSLAHTSLTPFKLNYPEDSVREEMRRLLDEKCQYETTAKESLRRVLQEKLDTAAKLADLERNCNGRFARQYYKDYFSRPVCRLCDSHSHLEEAVAEGNGRFAELKGYLNTSGRTSSRREQQEFVTANIGRSTTTDSLPHTSVAPPTPDSRSSLSSDPAFIPVRNGARQDMRRTHLSLTTYNHFSILSEQVDEAQETRLVGNSIVHGQLEEFCGRDAVS